MSPENTRQKMGTDDRGEEDDKTVSEQRAPRNPERCISQGPPRIIKAPVSYEQPTIARIAGRE